jgi:nickel transport protein
VLLAASAVLASASPRHARAHGVVAQVERSDGAVAVRLRDDDGRPLAGAAYVVQSPRGGEAPFAQGETDRHGWVAFTPDAAGKWTVRIADATGHGKTVDVDVASVATAAAPAASAAAPAPTLQLTTEPGGDSRASSGGGWTGSYAFRALAAVTAIVLAFRVLLGVQRARRAKGR